MRMNSKPRQGRDPFRGLAAPIAWLCRSLDPAQRNIRQAQRDYRRDPRKPQRKSDPTLSLARNTGQLSVVPHCCAVANDNVLSNRLRMLRGGPGRLTKDALVPAESASRGPAWRWLGRLLLAGAGRRANGVLSSRPRDAS